MIDTRRYLLREKAVLSSARIAILTESQILRHSLRRALAPDEVTEAADADVLLVDADGPEEPGLNAMRSKPSTLIIALSGRRNRAALLDAGADDCATLPVDAVELRAQIRALLRLSRRLHFLGKRPVSRSVPPGVRLTSIESRLYAALAANTGRAVPYRRLLVDVWGPLAEKRTHYLRVYVNKLRLKLEEDPKKPSKILTIPRTGYLLTSEEREGLN
jgi:two-component system, OmpR family, KDP operon response regulator KdpE